MSQIKQVIAGGTTYNVVQASAAMQKSLLLLVGGKIAFNSARAEVETIDTDLLVGALMTMEESKFDQVSAIVLRQVVVNGDGDANQVTIDNFQGSMVDYFHLVAGSVKANLDDFFTYLDSVNAVARAGTKAASLHG